MNSICDNKITREEKTMDIDAVMKVIEAVDDALILHDMKITHFVAGDKIEITIEKRGENE